ncbi:MAG: site-specific tyrosine recombinase/integron integrase [Promethearchaeota archaeon]
MKLSEAIPDFLIAKEIEEGCSKQTIRAYGYDLKNFSSTIGNIPISSIQKHHIRKFLRELHSRNYSKAGLARKIACLKSFFKFCEENEIIDSNPSRTIKSPKIYLEEALPKFLSKEDMNQLLELLDKNDTTTYDRKSRLYLIIRLMYASMARISEICNLKLSDFDSISATIKVKGKGNKERFIPIDGKTVALLKNHARNRQIETFDPDAALFVNTLLRPLKPRVVQRDLQLLREELPFLQGKKFTPHILRHTGATHLRQNGMDISELQDILGHSNPNTTRIYAKNDIRRLRGAYREFHPLEETD